MPAPGRVVQLHSVVQEIVRELKLVNGQSCLTEQSLAKWTRELPHFADRETIAVHLVIMAKRLEQARAPSAVDAMLRLAAVILASQDLDKAMTEVGLDPKQLHRLGLGNKQGSPLQGGIAAPTAAGVSMTNKRR